MNHKSITKNALAALVALVFVTAVVIAVTPIQSVSAVSEGTCVAASSACWNCSHSMLPRPICEAFNASMRFFGQCR